MVTALVAEGRGTAGLKGGGGETCLTGAEGWEKKSEALFRRLPLGVESPLKSNSA